MGEHPVLAELREEAARRGRWAWDAVAFVGDSEKERGTGSERETLLREVQLTERRALSDWCRGRA